MQANSLTRLQLPAVSEFLSNSCAILTLIFLLETKWKFSKFVEN